MVMIWMGLRFLIVLAAMNAGSMEPLMVALGFLMFVATIPIFVGLCMRSGWAYVFAVGTSLLVALWDLYSAVDQKAGIMLLPAGLGIVAFGSLCKAGRG